MKDIPFAETRRLRLEPLARRHLADYTALIAQPDVHRFLSAAAAIARDPASEAERIVGVSEGQWTSRGYGPFALFLKDGGAFVGRGGLFWIASLQDVEINYMFDPTAWGNGFATEVAARFLDIGFGDHRLERMIATTNPDNAASGHVLTKVGMTFTGPKDRGGGKTVNYYEMSRESWRLARAQG